MRLRALGLLAACLTLAQTPRPAFDVASIKRNVSLDPGSSSNSAPSSWASVKREAG